MAEQETAGKYYARVDYKQTMGVQDMAHHMAALTAFLTAIGTTSCMGVGPF